jgi:hypothetical protein
MQFNIVRRTASQRQRTLYSLDVLLSLYIVLFMSLPYRDHHYHQLCRTEDERQVVVINLLGSLFPFFSFLFVICAHSQKKTDRQQRNIEAS